MARRVTARARRSSCPFPASLNPRAESVTIALMSKTRTGNFPIGFRRGGSDWQKKSLTSLTTWAKSSGFAALDLMNLTPQDVTAVQSSGLRIGSVGLLDFGQRVSR